MAKKKAEETATPILELAVSFGNVNVGDKTARVGVTIPRSSLSVSSADKNLCGKRLTVHLLARAGGGQADQESIPGLEGADLELSGVADVKGFGVGPKTISAGLTFSIESIDVPTLARMAKRDGVVTVVGIQDIPEGEEGEDD